MAEHTKGPWFLDPASDDGTTAISSEAMSAICLIQHDDEGREWNDPVQAANANLIKAAPQLLAACKAAFKWIHTAEPSLLEVVQQLGAAIALAEQEPTDAQ